MGTEIVFVLIYPVALICVVAAIGFWLQVAKTTQSISIGPIRAFSVLIVGFAVSVIGLAVLSYIDSDADFTSLIRDGYYTEAQRSLYLPRRIFGNAILSLVFVLPFISFMVIPVTAGLIKVRRLSAPIIALLIAIAWFTFSLLGWLLNFGITPPYSLLDILKSTAIPIVIYGLPIPLAALLFLPRQQEG